MSRQFRLRAAICRVVSARRVAAYALAAATTTLLVSIAGPALAYKTTGPVVGQPCHERLTMDALRRARALVPGTLVVQPNRDERALIDDSPFSIDSDMHDFGSVALVLANRDTDLHGHKPDELDKLAPLHGNPALQFEHCLRSPDQDEPTGSQEALTVCRDAIRKRLSAALTATGPDGQLPDPAQRTDVELSLELRGSVDVSVPTFHFELGRALHAIQDSFSHSFRDPDDQHHITVVLNYVDFAAGTLNESVDGPVHRSGLDACEDLDTFRADRFELATEASTDLIMAMVDPSITSTDARLSAADAVMENYMSYENKGCTLSNNWCDAPELNYARDNQQSCGCRTVESKGGVGFGLAAAFGALVFAARRRRRTLSIGLGGTVGVLAFIASGAAHAQSAVEQPTVESAQPAYPQDQAVATDRGVVDTTPVHKGREGTPFGVIVEGGGALYKNGAFAGSVGVLYRLSSHFLLGVEGEYNPWFSTDDFNVKPGSTNIYADGVLRFPLHFQRVNLRSTLQAGISRMNFDLYGVPQGSVGPFVGVNVLGIDYELAKSLYLVINPAHIAVPIPKVSGGVPFYYPQYRLTLGIQFGA